MQKELNIINLLCNNIINRFEELESKGLIFHRPKQKGREFMKLLQKISDAYLEESKAADAEAYKNGIEEMHLIDSKLDEFLNTIYNDTEKIGK